MDKMAKFTQKITALNGVKICHRSIGDPTNPPVLMIGGLGMSMAKWGSMTDISDAGFRVIAFDNRGAGVTKDEIGEKKIPDPVPLTMPGANPEGLAPWCVDDMADDAVAVLDHYQIDKAHIVGASMGGLIAQNVAVRYPDRCLSLVPIMTSANLMAASAMGYQKDPAWFGKMTEAAIASHVVEGMSEEEVVEKSMAMMKLFCVDKAYPNWRQEVQDSMEAAIKIDYERGAIDWGGKGSARQTLAVNSWSASKSETHKEGLQKLTVPTLVLHGLYDPLIPIETGRELAELIPDARLVEYNGGHNIGNHETVTNLIRAAILEHITLHSN